MNKTYLRLENFQGQQNIIASLNIAIKSALRRRETLEHCLFTGKSATWLAKSVAYELGSNLHTKNASELDGDVLLNILTNLEQGDVVLIKNIHELKPGVAESLYRAMKHFECSVKIGKGKHQREITINLPSFTVIGTTARPDLVLSSFRDSVSVFQLEQL